MTLRQHIKNGTVRVGDKVKIPNSSQCWGMGDTFYEVSDAFPDGDVRNEKHGICSCGDLDLECIVQRQTVTLETLLKGDKVKNISGYVSIVLDRYNDIVFLSWSDTSVLDNPEKRLCFVQTVDDLKLGGYTVVQEIPEVEEMTVAQVCKALGKEVKIVKE